MSIHVLSWVMKYSEARLGDRLVLLALADQARTDEGGSCFPSVPTIMRDTRMSERAVQNSLRNLEQDGRITVAIQGSPLGTNLYQIRMERGAEIAPPKRVRGPSPTATAGGAESAAGGAESDTKTAPKPSTTNRIEPKGKSITSETADAASDPTPPDPAPEIVRADVERLCQHLAAAMIGNGCRPPTITQKWRDAARRLLDLDGKTEQQVHAAIEWCQADTFWRANVLSMPTLREKYDQMRLQAGRDKAPSQSRQQQETDDLFADAAKRMKATDPTPRTVGVFDDPRREFADHQVGPRGLPAAENGPVHTRRVAPADGGPVLW